MNNVQYDYVIVGAGSPGCVLANPVFLDSGYAPQPRGAAQFVEAILTEGHSRFPHIGGRAV